MIDIYNQVPSIYVDASRDFQFLSWLFNIVLNSVKHNVDSLYLLPNNKENPALTELLALTLGFKIKRNYDQKQLAALVEVIPRVLKCKGTIPAIKMAGEALIKASGTSGSFDCSIKDKCVLEVVLPKDLVDTTLFIDILPYILPAGMSCRIIRVPQENKTLRTNYSYADRLIARWHKDIVWNENTGKQTTEGPANMLSYTSVYEDGRLINPKIVDKEGNQVDNTTMFTNYTTTHDGNSLESHILNTGLLDNSVIPILGDGAMTDPKSNNLINSIDTEQGE